MWASRGSPLVARRTCSPVMPDGRACRAGPDEEVKAIIFAAEASGPKDDETSSRIVTRAEKTNVNAELLRLVLEGVCVIEWHKSEEDMRFKMTAAARRGGPDA